MSPTQAKYEEFFEELKIANASAQEVYGSNTTPCWTTLGACNGQKAFAETGGMASEASKYQATIANALGGIRWIHDL